MANKVSTLLQVQPLDRTLTVRTVTANTSVQDNDDIIVADGEITIELPAAVARTGKPVQIKNINNLNVTILPANGEFIDGYTEIIMQFENSLLGVVSTGTGWIIV